MHSSEQTTEPLVASYDTHITGRCGGKILKFPTCPRGERIHDMDHLKRHLVEEWVQFDQTIIDDAIKQWR